jgi:hypothetical protein
MIKHRLLQLGPKALADAMKHIWIAIDPGVINAIGGCVIKAEPELDTNNAHKGFNLKFTRFLFKNKGRYSGIEETVNEICEDVSAAHQHQFAELSLNHGRTMDKQQYDNYATIFQKNYTAVSKTERKIKKLASSQKLKVSMIFQISN